MLQDKAFAAQRRDYLEKNYSPPSEEAKKKQTLGDFIKSPSLCDIDEEICF